MKEIPVSDGITGDSAPKRPGMNANGEVAQAEDTPQQKRRRHRRTRRRKSKNKPEDGIQAETNAKTGSLETKNQDARPLAGEEQENKHFFHPVRGKRARRRNVHLRQPSKDTATSVNDGARPNRSETNAGAKEPAQNSNRQKTSTQNKKRSGKRGRHGPPRSHKNTQDNAVCQASGASKTNSNSPSKRGPHGQSNKSNYKKNAYAALDLGTNNCRLLIAVPQQPGRFKVIDSFSRIVRLGEGLTKSGRLSDLAMDRAVGALKICASKLENRSVRGIRLIATEACRQASNGSEFLQRVEDEAGLKLEIIDRETEAKLAVAGCTTLVDRKTNGVVLFDIGGGSSELALLDLRNQQHYDLSRAMVSWTSLPLGVVTLSERHGGGKLVTREVFEAMVDEVSELLGKFEGRNALLEAAKTGEIHLLGTSGTVTTLAGIHLKLPRYNRRQVDGVWMASKDVDTMINTLVDMSFDQRVSNPCIGQDRADLVLAGCAILVAIHRVWPCPRLRVADRGLREGLLTEMMNADNAWQKRPRYRRHRNKQPDKRKPAT